MDSYVHEVMEEGPKRYAIERPRLRIVRRAVQAALRTAAEEAERVYHQQAGVRSEAPEYIPPA